LRLLVASRGKLAKQQDASRMAHGISLFHDGRRVALKWHRLRRRMGDPLFGRDNLCEGLRLGASMEIDLRVTGDSDFAVLHDETLDGETNGAGVVCESVGGAIASLCYDAGETAGQERYKRRVLLLDDLAALLAGAHPDALLQFDMKDDLATVRQSGVERLRQIFSGKPLPLIISGDSTELILALKQELPLVRRGIEPSFRLIELFGKGDSKGAVAQLRSELAGPTQPEMVYLHWPMILHAVREGIDLVAICHGEGKKVDAWTFTLSDPEAGFDDGEWQDFSSLLALGVDQITTDEAVATERAFAARDRSG
jgi:glycerophosphoryl diester phosphodiesterase